MKDGVLSYLEILDEGIFLDGTILQKVSSYCLAGDLYLPGGSRLGARIEFYLKAGDIN